MKYFSYIARKWSKDFDALVEGVRNIQDIIFHVDEDDKFLVEVGEEQIQELSFLLSKSVHEGAWHDAVSKKDIVIIMSDGIHRFPLEGSSDHEIWQRMRDLEPGVREFSSIKEMIDGSQYAEYLKKS